MYIYTGSLEPKERASLPPLEEVEALDRRVERDGVHHRLIQVSVRIYTHVLIHIYVCVGIYLCVRLVYPVDPGQC